MTEFPRARPHLATVLCVLVAAAFPLIVFHQVAFGGKTLSTALHAPGVNGHHPPTGSDGPHADIGSKDRTDPGTSAWHSEPSVELNDRQYSSGEWPLWNPYQAAGAPHAANVTSAVFDPLLAAVNMHATPRVWDFSMLGAFCLGSAAMFLFVRSLGTRRLAALVGAAAFSIGGYFALYSNALFARGYIYLPILLLLVDRVINDRSPPWTVALGTALAAAVLIGMPETSIFVVGTAAMYALYRLATGVQVDRLRAVVMLGISSVLAFALASPLLVLFAEYLPLSSSQHQAGGWVGVLHDAPAAATTWAIPFINGHSQLDFLDSGLGYVRGWVGAGGLAAIAICLSCPRRFLVARAVPFFLGLCLVIGWKVYGLPGSGTFGKLPFFERLVYPAFLPPVFQFSLAVLVAVGIDGLVRGMVKARRLAIAMVVLVVVVAVGLNANANALSLLSEEDTWQWLGLAAAATVVVLGVAWAIVARPSWRPVAGAIAAVVIVLELVLLFPKSSYEQRTDPFQKPAWQELIEQVEGSTPRAARIFGLDGIAYPDTATALGLYDIRNVEAIYVKRYTDYVRRFISPMFKDRFVGETVGSNEGKPEYVGNPMFDLLGVKYVVADGKSLGKRAASSSQYRKVGQSGDISVFENRNAMPRAFLARHLVTVPSSASAMRHLRGQGFDPRNEAVVEAGSDTRSLLNVKPCTRRDASDRVEITEYRPQTVRVRVDAACPGLAVLSDTYFPGWHASVNGRSTTILPTDYLFRGVRVPAGSSVVEFRYAPGGFDAALWVARIATLAAIGWLAIWALRRSRRASGQTAGAK